MLSGVMLIGSATADVTLGFGVGGVSGQSRILHVLVEVLIFFVWRFCRGKPKSQPVLEALDAALTIALCTAWAVLGLDIPGDIPVEFSIMLGTTYTLIARSVLEQVSGALSEAHALGLIHRDIKPANIILTERPDQPDVVKVVDFGLVKTLAGAGGDVALTHADAITGTPTYLAPEAISAPDSVDARADLYAVGAVGYFLLTGQQVFEAATVVEMCSRHLLETPVSPSERLGRPVPPDLEALVLDCLAKKPEHRPASAAALRTRLLACSDATRYDVEEARSWWRDRAAKLRVPRRAQRSAGGLETMAIDLRGRQLDEK